MDLADDACGASGDLQDLDCGPGQATTSLLGHGPKVPGMQWGSASPMTMQLDEAAELDEA
jgi:hypothetical protein